MGASIEGNLAVKRDFEQELKSRIDELAIVTVTDALTYEQAGILCKEIVQAEKEVAKYWEPVKQSAHETWKGLVAKEKGMLDPLLKKKTEQVGVMKTWEAEEERNRKELEIVAQKEALKLAEDQALAEAENLHNEGRTEEAAAIISAPPPPVTVSINSNVPKGFGTFTRKKYKANVISMMVLVKAVAAGQIPLEAIQPNQSFLDNQARMMRENLKYPGVTVVCE